MPRPKYHDYERRSRRITVRFTESEYKLLVDLFDTANSQSLATMVADAALAVQIVEQPKIPEINRQSLEFIKEAAGALQKIVLKLDGAVNSYEVYNEICKTQKIMRSVHRSIVTPGGGQ